MTRQFNTLFIGKTIINLKTVDSTNQYIMRLMESQDLPEGTIITAEYQTEGRGQMNNYWESEAGRNLLMSVVLYPIFLQPANQFILNQAISLAVKDALQPFLSEKVSVKWPNDIYVGDKKIAGILIQNALSGKKWLHSVIGLGININQVHFEQAPRAGSLIQFLHEKKSMKEILDQVCYSLEHWYSQLKSHYFEAIQSTYTSNLFRKGIKSSFQDSDGRFFSGVIEGVSDGGKLIISESTRSKEYGFKEVEYII